MKTILVTAYAVNPFKGSEDGMGWNFIYQIARFNKVVALTRENNRPHIERFMAENPDELHGHITFIYFDLPFWMRFWKRKGQGAMLYFWMWQRAIPGFVKKKEIHFDVVHNLNFHNDWTPSYLWKLNKPMVWGPIGHHPQIPSRFLTSYQKKYHLVETLTWGVKNVFWKAIPPVKTTARKAKHILAMNSTVASRFPAQAGKIQIMPSVATGDFGWSEQKDTETFTVVSAGRLVPLKGFDLTLLAFAGFLKRLTPEEQKKCTLILVGSGPEKDTLVRLAQSSGIEKHVQFIGWMDRSDFLNLLKTASAFLFPSHEGAGMVVAEALSFGLPVVCLDNCGPGEFIDSNCGFAVKTNGSYHHTVKGLSYSLISLYYDESLRKKMSWNARKRFETHFHWDRRGEQLKAVYQNL